MSETVEPAIGTAVVHLFFRVGPSVDAGAVVAAVKEHEALEDGQVVPVAILGHKADLCLMALASDLKALRRLQTSAQLAGLEIVDSYVSLTELSEYAQDVPEKMQQMRLYPSLPPKEKPAWCFYPMSKRRNVGQNWFALPYEERRELMYEHGTTGRTFAGRILQLVTGSTGLDDWEWGVTLFAAHPDDLKEVVYTMRYDRASTQYGEFGTFYTGTHGSIDEVLREIGVN